MTDINREPGFYITRGRGFQIIFDNGWGISVQFGWGNYCANQDKPWLTDDGGLPDYEQVDVDLGAKGCRNAEIAILHPDGGLLYMNEWEDSVKGHITPDELLDVLIEVQAKVKDE